MVLSGGRRFVGQEEEALDYPINLNEVETYLSNNCSKHQIYLSGGILRYALVAINRLLKFNLIQSDLSVKVLRTEGNLMNKFGLSKLCNNMAIIFEK